jgi:hypothetical protein
MDDEDVAVSAAVLAAAEAASAALAALQHAAFAESEFPPDAPPPPGAALSWTAGMTAADLAADALEAAHRAAAAGSPVQDGRAYCYNCNSADCAHAEPNGDTAVFAGYQDTGRPQWTELCSNLLEVGDRRVADLFAERPTILARVVGRKRLIAQQLPSFGRSSLTYQVIGQLVAGYLTVRGTPHALTFQVVNSKQHRLHCQLLAAPALREALAEACGSRQSTLYRVHDALREARRRIDALNGRWGQPKTRAERKELEGLVFGHLRHLGTSIERKDRQGRRRTRHAAARAQERRPVHKACEDVANAGNDRFFRDTVKDSVIVLGRSGRSHVFNEAGRHITSLVIPGDKFDRRRQRHRYVPMETEAVAAFRGTVSSSP